MLAIHNLRFSYGKTPVLNIPNLNLNAGENLLIQGNSGSGKTSLLFLLAGFLTPTAGHIHINNTVLTELPQTAQDAFRATNLGFVFQQPHLMAPLTVLQNLLIANSMAGTEVNHTRAHSLLQALGIAPLADRKPTELSQGQMQRVSIARALMNAPKILLADEPTSALDDTAAEQVIKLLLTTAQTSGAQVIVTSHDSRITRHFPQTFNLSKAN